MMPQLIKLQRAKHDISRMAAKVADDPAAERAPPPPFARQVARIVRTLRRRSQPEIPRECLRGRRIVRRPFLRAIAAIEPNVRLTHLANHSAPRQFDRAAELFL